MTEEAASMFLFDSYGCSPWHLRTFLFRRFVHHNGF
jgi:hypothetical protein